MMGFQMLCVLFLNSGRFQLVAGIITPSMSNKINMLQRYVLFYKSLILLGPESLNEQMMKKILLCIAISFLPASAYSHACGGGIFSVELYTLTRNYN